MENSFRRFIEENMQSLKEYTLYMVCNTKLAPASSNNNYEAFDVSTEYLSDAEFEQVISLFSQCHLKNIEVFQNELSFIEYILSNKSNLSNEQIIVYSSAQSGIGAGRKSLIPAFCNLENLQCTGSNPYVVSLCRHKYHVNKLLESAQIPVPQTWLYDHKWILDAPIAEQKMLLKPIYESASIGIDEASLVCTSAELEKKISVRSQELKQPIIAQQFIEGYEVELPVFVSKNEIFPLTPVGLALSEDNLCMGRDFLNYERIYFDQYTFFDFCTRKEFSTKLLDTAKAAARLLGMSGLCRVDFRVIDKEHFYITDVSTNPHFINHSSVHFSFHKLNLPEHYIALCILLSALRRK